jgi:hypothetical protein
MQGTLQLPQEGTVILIRRLLKKKNSALWYLVYEVTLRTVKDPRDSNPFSVNMDGANPMLGRRAMTAEAPLKSGGPGTGATIVAGTFSKIAPSGFAAVSCMHTHTHTHTRNRHRHGHTLMD